MTHTYVLVACECSQVVTKAMRAHGAIAFSCDMQKAYGDKPQWHILGDCTPYLNGGTTFTTQDGGTHSVPRWDMIIAHPPCTYLSAVQSHLIFSGRGADRVIIDEVRYNKMLQAAEFFKTCLNAKCMFLCVENPQINLKDTGLTRPQDSVSPHNWGDKYSKRTWLWLRNLPPLIKGALRLNPKSYVYCTRGSKVRSKFFPEVAEAMAQQWLPIVEQYVKTHYYE